MQQSETKHFHKFDFKLNALHSYMFVCSSLWQKISFLYKKKIIILIIKLKKKKKIKNH